MPESRMSIGLQGDFMAGAQQYFVRPAQTD